MTILVGVGGFGLAGEFDGDFRVRRAPPPNGHALLLLQDHVVAENGRESERVGSCWAAGISGKQRLGKNDRCEDAE